MRRALQNHIRFENNLLDSLERWCRWWLVDLVYIWWFMLNTWIRRNAFCIMTKNYAITISCFNRFQFRPTIPIDSWFVFYVVPRVLACVLETVPPCFGWLSSCRWFWLCQSFRMVSLVVSKLFAYVACYFPILHQVLKCVARYFVAGRCSLRTLSCTPWRRPRKVPRYGLPIMGCHAGYVFPRYIQSCVWNNQNQGPRNVN